MGFHLSPIDRHEHSAFADAEAFDCGAAPRTCEINNEWLLIAAQGCIEVYQVNSEGDMASWQLNTGDLNARNTFAIAYEVLDSLPAAIQYDRQDAIFEEFGFDQIMEFPSADDWIIPDTDATAAIAEKIACERIGPITMRESEHHTDIFRALCEAYKRGHKDGWQDHITNREEWGKE
jgi:SAM-dependent MidA family methyltransferase